MGHLVPVQMGSSRLLFGARPGLVSAGLDPAFHHSGAAVISLNHKSVELPYVNKI